MEHLPDRLKEIAHCLVDKGKGDFQVSEGELRVKVLKWVRILEAGDGEVVVDIKLARDHRDFVYRVLRDLRDLFGKCLDFDENGKEFLSDPENIGIEHCHIPVQFPAQETQA